MRRWETLIALLAVIVASLSAIPIGGRPRPVLALAAILLLAFIGYVRLRAALASGNKRGKAAALHNRAMRIRRDRERRYLR